MENRQHRNPWTSSSFPPTPAPDPVPPKVPGPIPWIPMQSTSEVRELHPRGESRRLHLRLVQQHLRLVQQPVRHPISKPALRLVGRPTDSASAAPATR